MYKKYDYHEIRQMNYSYLSGQLKSKDMFLDRKLFIAVLNTIHNIEWLGWPKQYAIKNSAESQNVTQKSINEVLKKINYLTPHQIKVNYKMPYSAEANQLKKTMELN